MTDDQGYQCTEMEILLGEDGVFGATLGLDLSVVDVIRGSPAYGKFRVGDRIITINGELVNSAFGLEYLVQRHKPKLLVRVFQARLGFEYINAHIDLTHNVVFGLYLKDTNGRVFVARIDHGSLAYMAGLKDGDSIVHIQGHFVTNRDVAKEIILKYIREIRSVSMLVERAADENTKSVISQMVEASKMQPPSVMMAADVRQIVEQEQKRMKTTPAQTHNIVAAPGTVPDKRVNIASQHHSIAIRNDNPDKKLQHVGKKG